jgi:hypothetical protein
VFLDAFVADFGQPALEGLGFGAGDGLDQAEEAFGVPALEALDATRCFKGQRKGGDKLSPPFESVSQKRIAFAELFQVVGWICGIRQRGNDIGDDEPPLVVMNGAAHFLALEEGDASFGRVGGGGHRKEESGGRRWKIRID